jgi:Transposase/Glycosyltransferase like family 2
MDERTAGIDLASVEHRLVVVGSDGRRLEERRFAHSEDGVSALMRRLLDLEVARVAIEQPNGLVVDRLLDAGIAVVAVHPNQLAAARDRYRSGGGKSDGFDGYVLAELARTDMHRLRLLAPDNLSCVTAACLATRREVYDEVGGFDERLAVEYNDVDFCIRVRQAGYKIIWTPYAELRHHERASRGDVRRLPAERGYMRERWGTVLDADPFYNPNLTLDGKAFRPAPESRVRRPWLAESG